MLGAGEIGILESAIVESVAPEHVVAIPGWLVPLDDGSIGRAKSAVPLAHAADPDAVVDIEGIYAAARLPPAFRLAETPELAPVRDALVSRGYVAHTPTFMKIGTAAGLAALSEVPVALLGQPDEGWLATFTGEGFDPGEGAQRVRNLKRSPDVVFAAVREGGRTAAVGVGSFGRGWVGIHGMRTAPDARRRGYARAVLAAIGREAQTRGIERAVLQVVEDNPARTLYRAAGFAPVWRYHYWARPE